MCEYVYVYVHVYIYIYIYQYALWSIDGAWTVIRWLWVRSAERTPSCRRCTSWSPRFCLFCDVFRTRQRLTPSRTICCLGCCCCQGCKRCFVLQCSRACLWPWVYDLGIGPLTTRGRRTEDERLSWLLLPTRELILPYYDYSVRLLLFYTWLKGKGRHTSKRDVDLINVGLL